MPPARAPGVDCRACLTGGKPFGAGKLDSMLKASNCAVLLSIAMASGLSVA